MDYGTLEIAIAERLQQKLQTQGFDAIPLPETQAEYSKPFTNGRATVAFTTARLDKPQSTDEVSQHLVVTFSISLQSRFLRGEKGIHQLSRLVKQYLLGFRPQDCGRLYHVSHEFVRYEDGVWEHVMDFETKTLWVQEIDNEDEEEMPLLRQLDFEEKE
ncbi:MAG: hypothetical protein JNL72_08980 [Flavipsychrobacter sp.]|nr:hypothetical protein [Flavipsychrobacter sp.]